MKFKAFENKLWLASPTMYGEERMYVKKLLILTGYQLLVKI